MSTPRPLLVEVGPPTGVEVHPDLWGIFLEDLNDALDGGLNAELVRNGDFEFGHADHAGWGPLTAWHSAGAGSVTTLVEDPVHPDNGTYLRLTGPVTLTNEGFDPIRVAPGERWLLSLFTWRVSGVGEASCAVVTEDGEVLAEAELPAPARGWHHVSIDLEGLREGRGSLAIRVPEGLTLEIDVVSLRPLGPDGRPLTFRPDLLAALRELAPSFVRFPGGCLAHGAGLANMYHWKETVGPRHERRQTFNLWGYHQSRQIGYLEYFELCEELGATPMPIVAAGVCCQNLRGRARAIPMAEMPAYVQDVLDLVEFANGGPDTTWGARRAELGHPEPFGLRYLGVGNEDEITEDFRERYRLVADAVALAYPDVVIIGTAGPQPFGQDFEAGWEYARAERVAVIDEHAYRTPRWFHQNLDRYDTYPRDGGQVYFGEYAARTSSVRSALAEAAFMIAMERNGDVVRLASYAPLLARIGHTQWVPDLLYFDADRVLRTASYYGQQAFSRVRGVAVHEVDLVGADALPVPPWRGGLVRVSSPGADVEITDVVLDGVALAGARLARTGGEVELGSVGAGAAIELTATRTGGAEGLVLTIGDEPGQNQIDVRLGGWQNKTTSLNVHWDGISNDVDGPDAWSGLLTGCPVRVRVETSDGRVRVWVDDELRHDHVLDERPEHRVVVGVLSRRGRGGGVGVGVGGADGVRSAGGAGASDVRGAGEARIDRDDAVEDTEYVVRLVNATDEARLVRVALPGVPGATGAPGAPGATGAVSGELALLAGAGPDEGRAFEASPVEPVVQALAGDGGFEVELPSWSFAVAVVGAHYAGAGR